MTIPQMMRGHSDRPRRARQPQGAGGGYDRRAGHPDVPASILCRPARSPFLDPLSAALLRIPRHRRAPDRRRTTRRRQQEHGPPATEGHHDDATHCHPSIRNRGPALAALPQLAAAQDFLSRSSRWSCVIDVAGDLQPSQPALEKFAATIPTRPKFVFTQATAPELAGKLQGPGKWPAGRYRLRAHRQ